MLKPDARELRERVLRAYDGGLTQEEVASTFDISRTTLVYWLRRRRETGDIEPLSNPSDQPRPPT